MARPRTIVHHASMSSLTNVSSTRDLARVRVGPESREFLVNKKLLSTAAPFFRERLDESPAGFVQLNSAQKAVPVWLPAQKSSSPIFLLDESPAMFELFSVWLHRRTSFRKYLDDQITYVSDDAESESVALEFHWALVHLHIFAARHELHDLQDLAIDALQDLYLRCDWDVSAAFITFLFGEREAWLTIRLRRWAVAMVAWSLAGGQSLSRIHSEPSQFEKLLGTYQDFNTEYALHIAKLRSGKLDARIKNPQLRIPANKLRNEERQFGFRQCSFHTHRAMVGERRCPHSMTPREPSAFHMEVPLFIDIGPAQPTRKTRHGKSPSCLDISAAKPHRPIKHLKSPSCPVNMLPKFDFPDHVPQPLRPQTPRVNTVEAF
ncbi:hypothetical protein B0T11DRAFT_300000 [Plectosphaerella cucumerina]|uniref:BTB domain-containing protein n=1 Tax=Plectosphaerella cucumerina TaxID=40658 RepID=A0A8K0X1S4_9PEZI|nr:hypothetical protein B0T11DRAFT_300000 [Plectosphaerella cucumerina]